MLEVIGVSKSYGAVRALHDVSFVADGGERVAIVGDNGAGKSTLLKVLAGAHRPTAGSVRVNGSPVDLSSPLAAEAAGIQTVYQDLALVESLDVSTNIFLGHEPLRRGVLGKLGFVNKRAMRAAGSAVLSEMLDVQLGSVRRPVEALSGGQRQAVAIARAAARAEASGRGIILLDEPTAALGVAQTQKVEKLIERLGRQGHLVIVVSHDIPSVVKTSSRILVMRLGRLIADLRPDQVDLAMVVGLITGAVDPPPRRDIGRALPLPSS
jgi:simple sugar transport system ATP-binding protein